MLIRSTIVALAPNGLGIGEGGLETALFMKELVSRFCQTRVSGWADFLTINIIRWN